MAKCRDRGTFGKELPGTELGESGTTGSERKGGGASGHGKGLGKGRVLGFQ